MMCMFFQSEKVKDYKSATESNVQQYSTYFQEMLNRGVYLPPAQFEAMFISNSHTEQDIEKTIEAHFETLKYMFRA